MLAEPEVLALSLRPGDEFALLASDGLWDVLEPQVGWSEPA